LWGALASKRNQRYCNDINSKSISKNIKKTDMKKFNKIMFKWYAVIFAFICLLYSVGLGITGNTAEAQYSAHWPGTILLFAIAVNQIKSMKS
tara:strand:- start:1183 stop:1458 length:276 start_codon:yes stop_codon:yes gene_type:complete